MKFIDTVCYILVVVAIGIAIVLTNVCVIMQQNQISELRQEIKQIKEKK